MQKWGCVGTMLILWVCCRRSSLSPYTSAGSVPADHCVGSCVGDVPHTVRCHILEHNRILQYCKALIKVLGITTLSLVEKLHKLISLPVLVPKIIGEILIVKSIIDTL